MVAVISHVLQSGYGFFFSSISLTSRPQSPLTVHLAFSSINLYTVSISLNMLKYSVKELPIMLIRPCYCVLKAINYLCSDSDDTSSVDILVYFHQRANHLDLLNTIRELESEKYITMQDCGSYIQNIKPTYKGRHYRQYRWLTTKETLLKSFLLPIAVAFVTTLLTLAINGIFIPLK